MKTILRSCIAAMAVATLVLTGCADSTKPSGEDDASSTQSELLVEVAAEAEVDGAKTVHPRAVGLEITACAGAEVATEVVLLDGLHLDAEVIAEALIAVDAGCYDVKAVLLGDDGTPCDGCTPVTRRGVQVSAELTVEVFLRLTLPKKKKDEPPKDDDKTDDDKKDDKNDENDEKKYEPPKDDDKTDDDKTDDDKKDDDKKDDEVDKKCPELCDKTWKTILKAEAEADVWTKLARLYVKARLLIKAGIAVDPLLETTLHKVGTLLKSCDTSLTASLTVQFHITVLKTFVDAHADVDFLALLDCSSEAP